MDACINFRLMSQESISKVSCDHQRSLRCETNKSDDLDWPANACRFTRLRSSVLLCSLQNSTFPLEHEARKSFKYLKEELINVLLGVIHEDVVFASETDTSEVVISATYDERGSFVAFFERSFSKSELHMISVKKEL